MIMDKEKRATLCTVLDNTLNPFATTTFKYYDDDELRNIKMILESREMLGCDSLRPQKAQDNEKRRRE